MLQTLCKHISRSLIQSDYLTVSHIHFHAFPNSRKQKHSASINLRHPYHPICPSVRNCQYLLRSPSNSKMTCCAINLRGRGLCYQFSDTSVHDPGTFHIKYCKQFIDICPRHLEFQGGFEGLGPWKNLPTAEVSAKNYKRQWFFISIF